MDKSNNLGNSNVPYTKLSDDSKKDKEKSQWKSLINKFSTNTSSFPEKYNYKKLQ